MARVQVTTRFGPKISFVYVAPGLAVPTEYTIHVDDPNLPYVVELDIVMENRKPVGQAFRCIRRDDGEPVTAEGVRRVPLASIVRHSVEWVAMNVEGAPPFAMTPVSTDEEIAAAYYATARRRGYTEERIREVAKLYNEALERGEPPTKYVEGRIFESRSTVARRVRAAREAGYLKKREGA